MGTVQAHLATDQGHWVWLDGAVVGAIEAHLAAVAAVAEDVGRRGQGYGWDRNDRGHGCGGGRCRQYISRCSRDGGGISQGRVVAAEANSI